MRPDQAREVMYLFSKLQEAHERALNVLSGHIDATIHGRYFGDSLPKHEFSVLKGLAIRAVAREIQSVILQLQGYGLTVRNENEIPLTTADSIVAFYERVWPEEEDSGDE